jgi:hypothetical protein
MPGHMMLHYDLAEEGSETTQLSLPLRNDAYSDDVTVVTQNAAPETIASDRDLADCSG